METLALYGGPKAFQAEGIQWPQGGAADLESLARVAEGGVWGASGAFGDALAERFARFSGTRHAIPCANGTVAIELIVRALGLGRGDEIIVPPYTFIASISALVYAGVTPVFADIDPVTYTLSAQSAERRITPRTRALMPVYVAGEPCDLDAFEALSRKHDLYLIGDAAQAVGSQWRHAPVGRYGVAASFSCQNSKNLTSGEGGMITTDDEALYDAVSAMLAGGDARRPGLAHGMSQWQASMLGTQMAELDDQMRRRAENAAYLSSLLRGMPFVSTPPEDERVTRHARHLYVLRVHEDALDGVSRDAFIAALRAEGLGASEGYRPLHTFGCLSHPYVEKMLGGPIDLRPDTPVCDYICAHEALWLGQTLMLGNFDTMRRVADTLQKVYEQRGALRKGAMA